MLIGHLSKRPDLPHRNQFLPVKLCHNDTIHMLHFIAIKIGFRGLFENKLPETSERASCARSDYHNIYLLGGGDAVPLK